MYKLKLVIFGISASLIFCISAGLLANFESLPQPFKWPMALYVLTGIPLAALLDLIPAYNHLLVALFPNGGAPGAFVPLLVCGFVTWSLIFTLLRHAFIRRRHLTTQSRGPPWKY
jgi:hypothetical protein